ncbi:MAG: type II secretion system protein, partial [Planctomycetota bacterium]|nr:type II secretion system protein [Planctomycetota bacterium]
HDAAARRLKDTCDPIPSRKRDAPGAFTIIELLVVISIVAVLIAILLPAITKARDQAKLTQSQANLRNLAVAHASYAADWNDRQFTLCNDNLATEGWYSQPHAVLGWGTRESDGGWHLFMFKIGAAGNRCIFQPIVFDEFESGGPEYIGWGSFRIPNAKGFSQYVSGRFYDPVFYAPKDTIVINAIEAAGCWDSPDEFCDAGVAQIPNTRLPYWSSYCLSPAAMFAPQVMGHPNPDGTGGWKHPWHDLKVGFRSPSASQSLFPELKTRMLEHHWLQNRRAECNPGWVWGMYQYCEPYYFNHGWESVPMTLFYDGHVEGLGVREAIAADSRMCRQTGSDPADPDCWGLWSRDTPFGGSPSGPAGGYFMEMSYDTLSFTSFHTLTTDGIRGRDKLGDG